MKLKVNFNAGTSIKRAVLDMINLATTINTHIYTVFNGVEVVAWKGSDPQSVVDQYNHDVGNQMVLDEPPTDKGSE